MKNTTTPVNVPYSYCTPLIQSINNRINSEVKSVKYNIQAVIPFIKQGLKSIRYAFFSCFIIMTLFINANKCHGQQTMYIAPTGTMYTHAGAQMAVFGDVVNDATGGMNHNNGGTVYLFKTVATGAGITRIYDGPLAPSFTGNYNSGGAFVRFYNLVTDNSSVSNTPSNTGINTNSGSGQIQVEQELRISNQHTFVNGIVWTPRSTWKHAFVHYDNNSAGYSGTGNSTHIDGYAAKTGNSNFDFPIGDGIQIRPSGLSNPSNGIYKSAYFKKNPQLGTSGISGTIAGNTMRGGLVKISSKEFWDIDGTANSQFKLSSLNSIAGYSDWASDFVAFPSTDIVVTGWDGPWENLGINVAPTSLTIDGVFTTSASSTNPDNGNSWGSNLPFSAYTWGVKIYNIPLDLKLVSFHANSNNCAAELVWETADEVNTDRFEIEQSENGVNFKKVASEKANPGSSNHQYAIKVIQNTLINFYRLKMIDKDGKYTYSDIQKVKTSCSSNTEYISVYPNPVRSGQATLQFNLAYIGNATVMINNAVGQLIMKKEININAGNNLVPLSLKDISKGIYLVNLISTDGKIIGVTQKIIID